MSGSAGEIAANVLAESPVYIAAGVISYFVNEYVTLRLGHESLTTFIVIGLGLGGTWCGRFPWTKKWVWICAILFFVAIAACIQMLKNPDPGDILLLAEKFSLGLAFFTFFWMARAAGVGWARRSAPNGQEPTEAQ